MLVIAVFIQTDWLSVPTAEESAIAGATSTTIVPEAVAGVHVPPEVVTV